MIYIWGISPCKTLIALRLWMWTECCLFCLSFLCNWLWFLWLVMFWTLFKKFFCISFMKWSQVSHKWCVNCLRFYWFFFFLQLMSLSFVVMNPRVKFIIKHYRETYSSCQYPIPQDFGRLFCNFSSFCERHPLFSQPWAPNLSHCSVYYDGIGLQNHFAPENSVLVPYLSILSIW